MHSHDNTETLLRVLTAPRRNQFFYGKRMDVQHFRMEQDYGKLKRWLLNRTTLGCGVVCGLQVGVLDGQICVEPGLAIDPLGREIIVPIQACVSEVAGVEDSCCGGTSPQVRSPAAKQIADVVDGTYGLWLCYRECLADQQPMMVSECGSHENCAAGTVVESFCVKLVAGAPPDQGDPDWCALLWPAPDARAPALEPAEESPDGQTSEGAQAEGDAVLVHERAPTSAADTTAVESHRATLCKLFDMPCCPPDAKPCVPLALVTIKGGQIQIDACKVRARVYGNDALLDMILCLTDKIATCCGPTPTSDASLIYVSGDLQQAPARTPVANPLVVQVLIDGVLTANQSVSFEVRAGNGSIGTSLPALAPQLEHLKVRESRAETGVRKARKSAVAAATALAARVDVLSDSTGTATLPVWELGPVPGENVVVARLTAGGANEVAFRATALKPPNLSVIQAIDYLNVEGQVIASQLNVTLGSVFSIKRGDRPASIRWTFNKNINPGSVSTVDTTIEDPDTTSYRSVLIQRRISGDIPWAMIGGTAKVDGATITFTIADNEWRTAGSDRVYVMILNVFGVLEDMEGYGVDTDISADGRLPTGDGRQGGLFLVYFQMIDGQSRLSGETRRSGS